MAGYGGPNSTSSLLCRTCGTVVVWRLAVDYCNFGKPLRTQKDITLSTRFLPTFGYFGFDYEPTSILVGSGYGFCRHYHLVVALPTHIEGLVYIWSFQQTIVRRFVWRTTVAFDRKRQRIAAHLLVFVTEILCYRLKVWKKE